MAPTTPTTPITLLAAVNEMLASIGTAQVMTLDAASTNEEAQKALNVINNTAVEVQSQDWQFNFDSDYPMLPDADTGYILVPPNAVFKGVSERSSHYFVAERQNMLWDLKNHTYIWAPGTGGNVLPEGDNGLSGPLYVNMTWIFIFEDLPQPIRWLILCKAARRFATGRVPDEDTFKFTDTVLQEAQAAAETWDVNATAAFAEDNPHFWYMRRR